MVLACFLIESLRKEVTTDALDDHPYAADPLGPRRSPRPRPVDSHTLGHRAHRAARAADLRSQSRSLSEAHAHARREWLLSLTRRACAWYRPIATPRAWTSRKEVAQCRASFRIAPSPARSPVVGAACPLTGWPRTKFFSRGRSDRGQRPTVFCFV